MSKMIFVNLPVRDLSAATAFYERMGFEKNPQFCDDTASCMVWSDTIYVMLLTHEKFMGFSPRPIAGRDTAQALLCLSADSREEVDAVVVKAADGGVVDITPADDYGFMYGRSFEDPDGHLWQLFWMDVAAAQQAGAINQPAAA